MSEIAVTALNSCQQKLVANACVAMKSGQMDYVLEACAQVLRVERGCLAVRRLQWAAQVKRRGGETSPVANFFCALAAAWAAQKCAREPQRRLELAEKLLARNPVSVAALKLFARAAGELGLVGTAAFALEAGCELAPADRRHWLELSRAWLVAGKPAAALEIAERLVQGNSADAEAQALAREASVAQTMAKGNWESSGTFREKLRAEPNGI